MKYALFLDDVRQRHQVTWVKLPEHDYWVIARNYEQFCKTIVDNGIPEFISFDHDLHDSHYESYFRCKKEKIPIDYDIFKIKTGYHCAEWLRSYCERMKVNIPPFNIHSLNEFGICNINKLLQDAKIFP